MVAVAVVVAAVGGGEESCDIMAVIMLLPTVMTARLNAGNNGAVVMATRQIPASAA